MSTDCTLGSLIFCRIQFQSIFYHKGEHLAISTHQGDDHVSDQWFHTHCVLDFQEKRTYPDESHSECLRSIMSRKMQLRHLLHYYTQVHFCFFVCKGRCVPFEYRGQDILVFFSCRKMYLFLRSTTSHNCTLCNHSGQ